MGNFLGKNIFITGINGFIGSYAANHFVNKGANVVGLVREFNKKTQQNILNKCTLIAGDILDIDIIKYVLSKYEIDYVLHLAARPIVKICDNDPFLAYTTNIGGTLNILEAVRTLKRPPEKVMIKSTDKAYGPHNDLPYKEEHELVVADTYCTSKAAADMMARSYAKTYNLPVVVVRAGNIYGPVDLNLSRLIPRSIMRLLRGESPVLYGGAGNFIREFIYVGDAVFGYETVLTKGVPGEAYNIGGTDKYKIIDVITKVRDKIDKSINIVTEDRDFYEIDEQYLDGSKLMSLGWNPIVSLEEGLDKTVEAYRGLLCQKN